MVLPVTQAEAAEIGRALGRQPADPLQWSRQAHCPALDANTNSCQAYESRPQVCRDFQCNGMDKHAHSEESIVKLEALRRRADPVFDLRAFFPETIEQTLARHERIAFQFSGGKDSTAALLLMRPHWDKMTVYFCDSGDTLPETLEVVERFARLVPRFERIQGRTMEVRARWGMPTDVLPWTSAYAAHHHNTGRTPLMQDRVACCSRSVMAPLHERMVADGITLIIRGQKDCDANRGQFRSGDVVEGFEFLYPIQDWTDQQCFDYMRAHGVEPQRFYAEGLKHSGDCATCTAWCEDDRADYLSRHHPEKFAEYRQNMAVLRDSLAPAWNYMMKELEACDGQNEI